MAKENIAKFFSAAATDKALAEKLAALAAKHGCAFTAEELLECAAVRPLSDDEAAGVAAGGLDLDLFIKISEATRNRQIF